MALLLFVRGQVPVQAPGSVNSILHSWVQRVYGRPVFTVGCPLGRCKARIPVSLGHLPCIQARLTLRSQALCPLFTVPPSACSDTHWP